MMPSPVHSVLWFSLLVLWASQSETEALTPDVCQGDKYDNDFQTIVDEHDAKAVLSDEKNFPCYLFPKNVVNCSWTFPALQEGIEIFVSISVCDEETEIESSKSQGRNGSKLFHLPEYEDLYVILQFNISLHNKSAVYAYTYHMESHAVLSPPDNISVSVKDGDLSVSWTLPSSKDTEAPECFEYELDLGNQESPKTVQYELFYTGQNADPSRTYRVRVRTRMVPDCQDNSHWSDWSHVVTIEPTNKVNLLVIVLISLGIPMILLAVLLLVRYQRVSIIKILFPPIPRPPPKYIHFLEKHDTFNIFLPAPSMEPVEEITEVEDTVEKS